MVQPTEIKKKLAVFKRRHAEYLRIQQSSEADDAVVVMEGETISSFSPIIDLVDSRLESIEESKITIIIELLDKITELSEIYIEQTEFHRHQDTCISTIATHCKRGLNSESTADDFIKQLQKTKAKVEVLNDLFSLIASVSNEKISQEESLVERFKSDALTALLAAYQHNFSAALPMLLTVLAILNNAAVENPNIYVLHVASVLKQLPEAIREGDSAVNELTETALHGLTILSDIQESNFKQEIERSAALYSELDLEEGTGAYDDIIAAYETFLAERDPANVELFHAQIETLKQFIKDDIEICKAITKLNELSTNPNVDAGDVERAKIKLTELYEENVFEWKHASFVEALSCAKRILPQDVAKSLQSLSSGGSLSLDDDEADKLLARLDKVFAAQSKPRDSKKLVREYSSMRLTDSTAKYLLRKLDGLGNAPKKASAPKKTVTPGERPVNRDDRKETLDVPEDAAKQTPKSGPSSGSGIQTFEVVDGEVVVEDSETTPLLADHQNTTESQAVAKLDKYLDKHWHKPDEKQIGTVESAKTVLQSPDKNYFEKRTALITAKSAASLYHQKHGFWARTVHCVIPTQSRAVKHLSKAIKALDEAHPEEYKQLSSK